MNVTREKKKRRKREQTGNEADESGEGVGCEGECGSCAEDVAEEREGHDGGEAEEEDHGEGALADGVEGGADGGVLAGAALGPAAEDGAAEEEAGDGAERDARDADGGAAREAEDEARGEVERRAREHEHDAHDVERDKEQCAERGWRIALDVLQHGRHRAARSCAPCDAAHEREQCKHAAHAQECAPAPSPAVLLLLLLVLMLLLLGGRAGTRAGYRDVEGDVAVVVEREGRAHSEAVVVRVVCGAGLGACRRR